MMKQTTFASLAWNAKGRTTRRERFLAKIECGDAVGAVDGADRAALPEGYGWASGHAAGADAARVFHAAVVQPVRPASRGCALRHRADAPLCRIELAEDAIPDESTILRFRHLLEKHPLTQKIFAEVRLLPASGVTTSQRRTRSIGAGRRTLPWVTNDVALSRISNSSTATAGAPSTTITANLINIDNSISSGWKRAPVVTSKSRSAW